MTVLILGGTQEARELKAALGDGAILSLARDGGFGGPEGLARYVAEHGIEAIVDATHPFATRISANATHAGVPLMRLERPPVRRRGDPHRPPGRGEPARRRAGVPHDRPRRRSRR